MHKPSQQTLVNLDCVPGLMAGLPIPKLRQLGGKFGEEIMTALNITTVGAYCLCLCILSLFSVNSLRITASHHLMWFFLPSNLYLVIDIG